MTIAEAKRYIASNGGLLKNESLSDVLKRLPDYDQAFEESRMQSVMQGGRTCHTCSCHLFPPCQECVDCRVCNEENEA